MLQANVSFSQNVFHSYVSIVRQNVVLCGNGLNSAFQVLIRIVLLGCSYEYHSTGSGTELMDLGYKSS